MLKKSAMKSSDRSWKRRVSNTFGALGYLLCFLQWFWSIMLYFSTIQSVAAFFSSSSTRPAEQVPNLTVTLPRPLEIVIFVIVTVVLIGFTVYALIRTPINVIKKSSRAVRKTSESVAPIVVRSQHIKDTKQNHNILTSRLMLLIKLLLIALPLLLAILSKLFEVLPISYIVALIISVGLAGLSTLSFGLQYLVAILFRISLSQLW